jgi:hypothetical protein
MRRLIESTLVSLDGVIEAPVADGAGMSRTEVVQAASMASAGWP